MNGSIRITICFDKLNLLFQCNILFGSLTVQSIFYVEMCKDLFAFSIKVWLGYNSVVFNVYIRDYELLTIECCIKEFTMHAPYIVYAPYIV